jgi:transposase-like protein
MCFKERKWPCQTNAKSTPPRKKSRLLRLHLIEKEPVSDICDRHGLNWNVFSRWQKLFFENGAAAFNQTPNGRKDRQAKELQRQNAQLKAKLAKHTARPYIFSTKDKWVYSENV